MEYDASNRVRSMEFIPLKKCENPDYIAPNDIKNDTMTMKRILIPHLCYNNHTSSGVRASEFEMRRF